MKIECHCGKWIVDQSDDLPHKARLTPDQDSFATYDALDDEVIGPLADGQLARDTAYRLARVILARPMRLLWQCRSCGRLYIDDHENELHCYIPATEETSREILRSRPHP